MRAVLAAVAVLLVSLLLPAARAAAETCDAEGRCRIALGEYHLVLPEGAARPVPAFLYLHGWGGSAAGVVRNRALRAALAARGYALIAPEGIPSLHHRNRDWGVADGSPHPRDDLAFLAAVAEDAARHGVDRSRILMAGFSRGASMVWDVACRAPGTARAYAPVSGAFWEPMPTSCAGGVDLFHIHGWTDRVVPLEGRAVAGGRLVQGDVFGSLRILRAALGCNPQMPDEARDHVGGAELWTRRWSHCPGGDLVFVLHPGGHALPPGWLTLVLDWFEGLRPARQPLAPGR